VIEASDITQEHKDDFIRLIYEGLNPAQAAEAVGSTGTQFRRLRNPAGEHYDEAHAAAFKLAITSEGHEVARLERIRDLVWKRAEGGDSRMIEKLALIYDPDWRELRHQNLNVNVGIIARMLPHISTAELERALAEMEDDHPVLEAPRALPAA
jgi:hypothetical protein